MSNCKYSDLCAGKGVAASTLRRKKKKTETKQNWFFFGVCRFLWCKYSYHDFNYQSNITEYRVEKKYAQLIPYNENKPAPEHSWAFCCLVL